MVVLDTTFIIHFLKNKSGAVRKAEKFSGSFCTTRINVFEVLIGIYFKKTGESEVALSRFSDFLRQLKILELDSHGADYAAKISAELNRTGKTVSHTDVLIAGIALAHGQDTILTENTAHFSRIKGINVESY